MSMNKFIISRPGHSHLLDDVGVYTCVIDDNVALLLALSKLFVRSIDAASALICMAFTELLDVNDVCYNFSFKQLLA